MMTTERRTTVPPLGPAVFDALDLARATWREAAAEETASLRYSVAHMAALRAAAAVLAARPDARAKRGSRSAWALLDRAAPELGGWAAYFAAGAAKRAASEADLPNAATEVEAADLLVAVRAFIEVVENHLGLLPGATEQQSGQGLTGVPTIPAQGGVARAS